MTIIKLNYSYESKKCMYSNAKRQQQSHSASDDWVESADVKEAELGETIIQNIFNNIVNVHGRVSIPVILKWHRVLYSMAHRV